MGSDASRPADTSMCLAPQGFGSQRTQNILSLSSWIFKALRLVQDTNTSRHARGPTRKKSSHLNSLSLHLDIPPGLLSVHYHGQLESTTRIPATQAGSEVFTEVPRGMPLSGRGSKMGGARCVRRQRTSKHPKPGDGSRLCLCRAIFTHFCR